MQPLSLAATESSRLSHRHRQTMQPITRLNRCFDGNTHLELAEADAFDLTDTDFTITARLRTAAAGTIFALTEPGPKWIPNGQTFFVRGGRLCFDIGWVGVVTSRSRVDDGEWHNVAVTGRQSDHRVRLYVDGRLDAEGVLAPKAALPNRVVRIGFTAPDFPQPESYFTGELAEVRFYSRQLRDVLQGFTEPERDADQPLARWVMEDAAGTIVRDRSGHEHDIAVRRGDAPAESALPPLLAGLAPRNIPAVWSAEAGRLRLRIPKGSDPLSFTIWTAANAKPDAPLADAVAAVEDPVITDPAADLTALTRGGPAQWPQKLTTQTTLGDDSGPFAADELILPESNPWLAQVRPTGLDFFEDGRIAVCTWDGDVWLIESPPGTGELHWQRIATGLFQPLGLKIVNGTIHVICRDQLAALRDLNGDGEIDFYECLNNDHQVTEHFHEFAMGLQVDADGNFYYAKSGRHALPAVVPQHGTLLRISPDGARTDILATGFRAANGVCLNPDGSFVVTDQEGFWNPKNRINWVTVDPDSPPKFYGNMLGYTDVTDPSDSAMEPPLCWITNAFDRSPAELLWVESDAWQPLRGSLLNLSYGNGEVFLVPHEQVAGVMQGG